MVLYPYEKRTIRDSGRPEEISFYIRSCKNSRVSTYDSYKPSLFALKPINLE